MTNSSQEPPEEVSLSNENQIQPGEGGVKDTSTKEPEGTIVPEPGTVSDETQRPEQVAPEEGMTPEPQKETGDVVEVETEDLPTPKKDVIPNDKESILSSIREILEAQSALSKSLIKFNKDLDLQKLSIYELNEILSEISKLNKQLSISLDRIAELKSNIVLDLRVKTRRMLNE